MLETLDRQRADLASAAEQLATLTARAVSTDRLIEVTVDARGLLVDLQIEPAALRRHRASVLAELITDLVAVADQRLRHQREHLLAEVAGTVPGYADVSGGNRT
ncbi:YbaB/EbfC family nucleoid-associated protein [Gordonia sp. NPDC003950]|jgi:DNA-binding protein YbaB